jgi:hypothetical protein
MRRAAPDRTPALRLVRHDLHDEVAAAPSRVKRVSLERRQRVQSHRALPGLERGCADPERDHHVVAEQLLRDGRPRAEHVAGRRAQIEHREPQMVQARRVDAGLMTAEQRRRARVGTVRPPRTALADRDAGERH